MEEQVFPMQGVRQYSSENSMYVGVCILLVSSFLTILNEKIYNSSTLLACPP